MFQCNGLYHSHIQRLVFSCFVFVAAEIDLSFVWIGPIHIGIDVEYFCSPGTFLIEYKSHFILPIPYVVANPIFLYDLKRKLFSTSG